MPMPSPRIRKCIKLVVAGQLERERDTSASSIRSRACRRWELLNSLVVVPAVEDAEVVVTQVISLKFSLSIDATELQR